MWISWNMGQVWSSRSVLCGQIWHWPICGEHDIICSKQDGTNWNMWEHLQITEQLRDFCSSSLFFTIFLFGYENCSLGDTTLTELNAPPRSRWLSRPSRPAFAIQTKSGPQLEAVVFRDHLVGFLKKRYPQIIQNSTIFVLKPMEASGSSISTDWWILLPVSGTNRSSMTCSVAFGLRAAFACAAWRPYNLGSEKRISIWSQSWAQVGAN